MKTYIFTYWLPLNEQVGKPASACKGTALITAENEHNARIAFREQYDFFTIDSVRCLG